MRSLFRNTVQLFVCKIYSANTVSVVLGHTVGVQQRAAPSHREVPSLTLMIEESQFLDQLAQSKNCQFQAFIMEYVSLIIYIPRWLLSQKRFLNSCCKRRKQKIKFFPSTVSSENARVWSFTQPEIIISTYTVMILVRLCATLTKRCQNVKNITQRFETFRTFRTFERSERFETLCDVWHFDSVFVKVARSKRSKRFETVWDVFDILTAFLAM